MQASGYVDLYGQIEYTPSEPLDFDYGIKIGAAPGFGIGVYVAIAGEINISYTF